MDERVIISQECISETSLGRGKAAGHLSKCGGPGLYLSHGDRCCLSSINPLKIIRSGNRLRPSSRLFGTHCSGPSVSKVAIRSKSAVRPTFSSSRASAAPRQIWGPNPKPITARTRARARARARAQTLARSTPSSSCVSSP